MNDDDEFSSALPHPSSLLANDVCVCVCVAGAVAVLATCCSLHAWITNANVYSLTALLIILVVFPFWDARKKGRQRRCCLNYGLLRR